MSKLRYNRLYSLEETKPYFIISARSPLMIQIQAASQSVFTVTKQSSTCSAMATTVPLALAYYFSVLCHGLARGLGRSPCERR